MAGISAGEITTALMQLLVALLFQGWDLYAELLCTKLHALLFGQ